MTYVVSTPSLKWAKRLKGRTFRYCKKCQGVKELPHKCFTKSSSLRGALLEQRVYGSDSNPVYNEQMGVHTYGKADFFRKCEERGLAPSN